MRAVLDRLRPALPAGLAVVLLTAFFTVASYPGFMSFDSLEALRQARSQVEGSQYPPFGSYVWRVFDWIWPGPTLMQLFQNALLLGSFAWILCLLRWHPLFQIAGLAIVAALPPLTGTMLVVWKDVAVAAFFLAAFATLFHVRERAPRSKALIFVAVLLAFCGMAYRFNAASGALPLLVYAMWLGTAEDRSRVRAVKVLLLGVGLLFALFALVWAVNSFRFPTLERLDRNTNVDGIMHFDLIGISRYSGESVVPDRMGGLVDPDYLRSMYDARHLNMTSLNDTERRVGPQAPGEVAPLWFAAVKKHPLAYLKHRAAVFREYIGLHRHEVFYVTHPSVDENKLGVAHTPNKFTRVAVSYVWESRDSILERPWVYYLAAVAAVAAMFARRNTRYRREAVTVLASGLLYLAPMFFITPAADVRYNFWSICGALVSVVFVLSSFRARPYERSA